ncbi:MAG TPA: SMP-30/gluconolactonase/LRE family protein, partial [Puia sp.]
MRYLFISLLAICGRASAQAPAFDSGLVVAEGAIRPQLVSRQFAFTEGAAVDKSGNVFFTDQPNNKIWEYTLDGELTVFMDSAGRSNGMYFDPEGRLVSCADEQEQLWSIGPDRGVKVLL